MTQQAGMTQQATQQMAPPMPTMQASVPAAAAPVAQTSAASIPGIPSAAQPLPASVIPQPIGNVGGAPSLHGAPVPAGLGQNAGGPHGAQSGPGGYLANGGGGTQMGGTMGQTNMSSTMGAGSTMNATLNTSTSSMPVAESPGSPSPQRGGGGGGGGPPGGGGGGGGGGSLAAPTGKMPQGGAAGPSPDDDDDDVFGDDDEFDEVEAPEPPWLAEDLPSHDLAETDVPVLPGTSDTSANEFHPEGKVARRDEMAVEGLGEEKVYAGGEPVIEGHIKPAEDVMEPGERLVIPVELEQVVPGKGRMPDQVVHEGDVDTTVYILDVKDKPQRRRTCQPPEGELPPSAADDVEAHIEKQTVPSRFQGVAAASEEKVAAGMASPQARGGMGFTAPAPVQQQAQPQQQMQPNMMGSINEESGAAQAAALARMQPAAQQQAPAQEEAPKPAGLGGARGLAALKAAGKDVAEQNAADKGPGEIPAGKNLTMQEMAYFNRIYSLCRHNKYREIENLLEKGAPVDATDEFGNTPLIIAAQNGYKRMTKLLLRHNADINAQNNKGNTPLHFAYIYGFKVLAEYLKEKGADDTIRNDQGLTCYMGFGK